MKRHGLPGRTIQFWVRYNPALREVMEEAKFKYQLAQPSADSGEIIVQMKGFYFARNPGLTNES